MSGGNSNLFITVDESWNMGFIPEAEEETVLGNLPASKFLLSSTTNEYFIVLKKTRKDFSSLNYRFSNNKDKQTYDLILSTFKFLDQEISNELKTKITSVFNQHAIKSNLNLENIIIHSVKNFYNNIYTVSYEITGNPAGNFVLVGNTDGEWIVGKGNTYCKWIKESDADEATKAFMGGPSCGY